MSSRRILVAAGLCGVLFLLGARTHARAAASPEAELSPILDQMDKTANAHDVNAFMNFYEPSPQMLMVFNGSEVHGFDALKTQQAKWWQDGKTDVVYTRESTPEFTVLSHDAAV